MATPVIDSITASKSVVAPGEVFTVTIEAHDPDSQTIDLTGTVSDAGGNTSPAKVSIRVEDPLKFALEGVPDIQPTSTPGVFQVRAP